ncbi:MAG: exopolyphosphatase, partial [Rhodoferax sp.]
YFPDGQFTSRAFEMAEVAAKAVLDEALEAYHHDLWDTAYGSAGTVGAIGDVLAAAGWPSGVLTQEGLDWIVEKLLLAQSADKVRLPGMREDRKAIIGGGVSVMRAVFSLLGIETMQQANGGLRHGLIADLLGTGLRTGDLRQGSVQRLATKFGVDQTHGERVGVVAEQFFKQAVKGFGPAVVAQQDRLLRKLKWAARLHEIGSHISHSDYHKHGAYILDNADAMGFSLSEMHRLSLLVLGHRGKLRKLDNALTEDALVLQLFCLRLAVILCHARRDPELAGIVLSRPTGSTCSVKLSVRNGWSKKFPQSAHLLHEEVLAWQKTPWTLELDGL